MRLFILSLLLAVSMPGLTRAQNVLVPHDSGSSAQPTDTPPAPTPAPKMSTSGQVPAQQPSLMEKLFGKSSSTAASPAKSGPLMTTEQQNIFIQREQQNLSMLQQSYANAQMVGQSLTAAAATPPSQPNAQQASGMPNTSIQFQAMHQQTTAKLYDAVQQSQQRLNALQSGPLSFSDVTTLYQTQAY